MLVLKLNCKNREKVKESDLKNLKSKRKMIVQKIYDSTKIKLLEQRHSAKKTTKSRT